MSPHDHKPYGGTSRKLLLAFDIGTTFSGAAYAVLDPGEVPTILPVQRYPCQVNEQFKIPSILLYTKQGKLRAVGAEVCDPLMVEETEEKGHTLVEWFKLCLLPAEMARDVKFKDLDVNHKLPPKKTPEQVFADFLCYMFKCSKDYIIESRANGESLWDSVSDSVVVVLTHPNGWEGLQQGKMREVAVLAGIIPDTPEGHTRLHFVSEGEASLHFCVDAGLTDEFEDGTSVLVIDAGGGTIDSSAYCFKERAPLVIEETAAAECVLEGSTRVNLRAEKFLRSKFANTGRFGSDDYIRAMLEAFDKAAKLTFKDSSEKSFIKFGGLTDKSPDFGIRNGQFSLSGSDMAKLFDPAIDAVEKIVRKQKAASMESISHAFLVGGFAANTYLFNRLKAALAPLGMSLSRPGQQAHKAVAVGAVSHFIDNYVAARVAKFTIGIECMARFDEDNKEHQDREDKIRLMPPGILVLPSSFTTLVSKGKRLREGEEYFTTICRPGPNPAFLKSASKDIVAYRGNRHEPEWMDIETHSFSTLCTVEADTSNVAVLEVSGIFGITTYLQKFDIVLCCGKTELTAQLRWEEDGVEKRGPATIAYNDNA